MTLKTPGSTSPSCESREVLAVESVPCLHQPFVDLCPNERHQAAGPSHRELTHACMAVPALVRKIFLDETVMLSPGNGTGGSSFRGIAGTRRADAANFASLNQGSSLGDICKFFASRTSRNWLPNRLISILVFHCKGMQIAYIANNKKFLASGNQPIVGSQGGV